MSTLAPPDRTDALEAAALRLESRFGPRIDLATIRRTLDDCYERLVAQATVTTYLVVLAERNAARRLAVGCDRPCQAVSPGPALTG